MFFGNVSKVISKGSMAGEGSYGGVYKEFFGLQTDVLIIRDTRFYAH